MKKQTALLFLALIAACSPANLQSARISEYKHGKPYYSVTGYTDFNETEPSSSRRHIEHALSDACPAGVEIDTLQEYDAGNGAGNFLYWEALAGCK